MKTSIRGLYSRAACTFIFVFLLLAMGLPAAPAGQALAAPQTLPALPPNVRMIKDINPTSRLIMESGFIQFGESLYFSGRDYGHGAELWTCSLNGTGMTLVKDIYPGSIGSSPVSLVVFNDALYFFARTPESGQELWKSDGTEAGTVLVKDINPGQNGQNVYMGAKSLTEATIVTDEARTYLFFAAATDQTGSELWRTDGTEAGTVLVKEIYPGAYGSNPYNLTAFNNAVYFSARDLNAGFELFKSNGTADGTVMAADIYPGSGYGSNPSAFFVMPVPPRSSILVFSAQGVESGIEVYFSNTSGATGVLADINPGRADSRPGQFRMLGSDLYFAADDGAAGRQIWRYNGINPPTRVTNINAPTGAGWINIFPAASLPDRSGYKDWLLFAATDAEHGYELWKTDGTTSALVKDINPGPAGSDVKVPVNTLGKIYFSADNGTQGSELWSSNGTDEGTLLVKDLLPGTEAGRPSDLIIVKNRILFNANIMFYENYPWRSDGTEAGTNPINNNLPVNGPSQILSEGTVLNRKVVFAADTVAAGIEPWVSDGTPDGTVQLADVLPGTQSSRPGGFTRLNDKVLFNDYAPDSGRELWITDGTPGGTGLLKDLLPGMASSSPQNLTAVRGIAGGTGPEQALLFFTTQDSATAVSLWKTDGTPEGTQRIDVPLTSVGRLMAGSGMVFLTASSTPQNGTFDIELWKSDGTPGGTVRLKDIRPGDQGSDIWEMVFHNGLLYFSANDGQIGAELWKSDGTADGTVLVKDISPADEHYNAGSSPAYLTPLGSKVVFSAESPGSGGEIWITDGTESGTVQLRDIYPGQDYSHPSEFFTLGSTVYFTADDGSHGGELWKTDGTPAGTVLVKDIYAGPESSFPSGAAGFGDMIYFQAFTPEHGSELWVSKGDSATTQLAVDIYPGVESSWSSAFYRIGNSFFFTASDGEHSYEPWIVDVPIVYLPMLRKEILPKSNQ